MPYTREEVLARRRDARLFVGRRLAIARQAAGLSQQEAARRIGVAQSAIAKIELGKRAVAFTEALELADLYGISPAELDPRAADQHSEDAAAVEP